MTPPRTLATVLGQALEWPGLVLVAAGWVVLSLADRAAAALQRWEQGYRYEGEGPDEGWE